MEQYPTAFLHASRLPLPKETMKKFLKALWDARTDSGAKATVEVAYMHLANFREDVGAEPVDGAVPKNASLELTLRVLDKWQPLMEASIPETEALAADIQSWRK